MPDAATAAIGLSLPETAIFAPYIDPDLGAVTRRGPQDLALTLSADTDTLGVGDNLAWQVALDRAPRAGTVTVTALVTGPGGATQTVLQTLDAAGLTVLDGQLRLPDLRGDLVLSASFSSTIYDTAAPVSLAPFPVAGALPALVLELDSAAPQIGASLIVTVRSAVPQVAAALDLTLDNGTDPGAPRVVGSTATWTIVPVTPGPLELTLTYPGDARFIPATVTRNITAIQPDYHLSLDLPDTVVIGAPITLAAALAPAPLQPGEMTFLVNDVPVAVVRTHQGGRFVTDWTPSVVGPIRVTATWSGGAAFTPVTSDAVEAAIVRRETSISLSSPDGRFAPGDQIAVTASVTPDTATGTVIFLLNGQSAASVPVVAGIARATIVLPVGQSVLGARYVGDDLHTGSEAETVTIRTLDGQDVLDDYADEVLDALTSSSRAAAGVRAGQVGAMVNDARQRLADRRAGDEVTRNYLWSGLDPDGIIRFSNGTGEIAGAFQGNGVLGGFTQFLDGNFSVVHQDGATTGQFGLTMLLERPLGQNSLGGFILGAEVGRSRIGSTLDGTVDRMGLSFGAYGVTGLSETVYLDGFLLYTRSYGQTTLSAPTLSLDGDFTEDSVVARISLSGEYVLGDVVIEPTLGLSHVWASLDPGRFDVRSGLIVGSGTLDDATWSMTELRFAPRITWTLDDFQTLWIEPAAQIQTERVRGITNHDTAFSLGLGAQWQTENGAQIDVGLDHAFGGLNPTSSLRFSYDWAF
jgi:hypothetical protein